MPLVNLKSLIEKAEAKGCTLGGFNILNQEMFEGVVEATQISYCSILDFKRSFEWLYF